MHTGVTERFLADPNPEKINLGVGAYRDDRGNPVVLDVVREAERRILGPNGNGTSPSPTAASSFFLSKSHEYLPIGGHRDFCLSAIALAYGDDAPVLKENRVAVIQALSGTGACRVFADFQRRWFPPASKILIPKPTWSNHHNIWRDAGVPIQEYPYYDADTKGLAIKQMLNCLSSAEPGSVVLLHACAHNPTGVDPSPDQWRAISQVIADRRLFPLFDQAYLGFASGDFDKDSFAIRQFLRDGHTLALAQSFAKNMGLYGQRVGTLSVVAESEQEAKAVESQLKAIARPMYSNPPLHGALLVHTVLSDPELKQKWFGEVAGMANRIIDMRHRLRSSLEGLGSRHDWSHITSQIGMFCFLGINEHQVKRLIDEHSIYLTSNGRISVAGVNSGNVDRLAQALHQVTSS